MEKEKTVLTGLVDGIIYQNPENSYTVVHLITEDDDDVTATGYIPGVCAGETLILTGHWTNHSFYGKQFKADTAKRKLPETKEAVFRYLASGAIKNIGPARAADIVDMFGAESLDIIESSPERLSMVKGISYKTAVKISEEYQSTNSLRRLTEFLGSYQIDPRAAVKVYRLFGDDSMNAVQENPYLLTEFGTDFQTVDAMAISIGFDAESYERLESAVKYMLEYNLTRDGHTFLPYLKLSEAVAVMLSVSGDTVRNAMDMMIECGTLVKCMIANTEACYLPEIYEDECMAAYGILNRTGIDLDDGTADEIISRIEQQQNIQYSEQQREAVRLARTSKVLVITGGPGTGKTTVIRAIVTMFEMLSIKTALCAPTGRAAKRLSDVCGDDAVTIHRLLEAGIGENDTTVFLRNEDFPLKHDAIIVDEMSMVDISLMANLIRALKPGTRLVLVGDSDQLPSVGPGNVFSDIIKSGIVTTVRLTEIFRQAQQSKIIRSAHQINRGEVPSLKNGDGDFYFMRRLKNEDTCRTVVDLYSKRLPENMKIPVESIQVLSPHKNGVTGTKNLNKVLQAALNPSGIGKKEHSYGDIIFREGDKIMQTVNNYDIMWQTTDGINGGMGVFNGDIGFIENISPSRETVTVNYDDKRVEYTFGDLDQLEHAFAMTVHKAQGSEYDAVVLALSGVPKLLSRRSLLYTAVTRAKKLLVIVGDNAVITQMINNNKEAKRYSGLRVRIAEEI